MPPDAPTAFFSYSREDLEFALRLAKDLKNVGASVWMDKLDIRAGQLWERMVEAALAASPRVLVILTPSSVSSPQVMAEVAFALDEQKEVIPVVYRDCKIPYRLRPIQYVDFRNVYADAFEELLQSMGVERPPERNVPKPPPGAGSQPEALTDAERVAEEARMAGERVAERARLEEKHRAAEKARVEQEQREREAAERARSEETERALQAAAARARGEHSHVEMGSTDEGSFVRTKFSWTFVRGAIAVGILVSALLVYLAVRPKPQNGASQTQAPAATSSSPSPAETLSPQAMNARGDDYYYGRAGLPKNYEQAVNWYRKAADAGSATGMTNLGWMYQNGYGLAKDYPQAVSWYRKAAEAGDAQGMQNLGVMYADGSGLEQNKKEAVAWYRKAAEAGNSDGMASLGWMLRYGSGVEKDSQQAVIWYRKAAEAGNALAMNNLGNMYLDGDGVEKDKQQAIFWYRKAAKLGNQSAMDALKSLGVSAE